MLAEMSSGPHFAVTEPPGGASAGLPTPSKYFQPAVLAVALPGAGSDAQFAREAFEPACAARGLPLRAVQPDPSGVVASYRAALARAADQGPVLVLGISLGAGVAVHWARDHPDQVAGIVAALPAWTGPSSPECPAAASAAAAAAMLRDRGLAYALEHLHQTSAPWLARALTRSWRAQWPQLPGALQEAAEYDWPDRAALASVPAALRVLGAHDDPVHPWHIAREWAQYAQVPLQRLGLADIAADPGVLGNRGLSRTAQPG